MTIRVSAPRQREVAEALGGGSVAERSASFEHGRDAMAVLDARGRIREVNRSFENLVGLGGRDLVGERFLRWIHPAERRAAADLGRSLIEDGRGGEVDARVRAADGTWIPMRWSAAIGPGPRVHVVGRDRSGRVSAEEALLREKLAELRLRTALELHDGILQTLTGASLQLAAARRLIRRDPEAVEHALEVLGEILAAEQRDIRLYVDEVRGLEPAWTDDALDFSERIETISRRVGLVWGLRVLLDTRIASRIPPEQGRQVLRIVQEATVNAARHGDAKSVSVRVTEDGADLSIEVVDDGQGFSFLGEYEHEALKEKRLGPLSLKHRVEDSGGRIFIHSTPNGSTVRVRLPLRGRSGA